MITKTIEGNLKIEQNNYYITHKRKFVPIGELPLEDKQECFDFAYEMAFGKGAHRNHRSGGVDKREPGHIFIDTYQGKLAEYAFYRFLINKISNIQKPDITIEGLGKWDTYDFNYMDLHIAVKSTKMYGNLLLLETKDWSEEGYYIPNMNNGTSRYDLYVLLRLSPDGCVIMEENEWLEAKFIDKAMLYNKLICKNFLYDIAGSINIKDFKRIIKKNYVIPQKAKLNGKIEMDADNYYVQAGDMRDSNYIIYRLLQHEKEKI